MAIPLTPETPVVSFGVPDGHTLTVTVLDGDPVEFAPAHRGGPFGEDDVDGEIASGDAHDFDAPVALRTTGTSAIEVEVAAPEQDDLTPAVDEPGP